MNARVYPMDRGQRISIAALMERAMPDLTFGQADIILREKRDFFIAEVQKAFAVVLRETPEIFVKQHPLTPREFEIIRMICQGASNKEIAAALVISENTAKTHVGKIMAKLHAGNRTQVALEGRKILQGANLV